jgi:hypothetical protein
LYTTTLGSISINSSWPDSVYKPFFLSLQLIEYICLKNRYWEDDKVKKYEKIELSFANIKQSSPAAEACKPILLIYYLL